MLDDFRSQIRLAEPPFGQIKQRAYLASRSPFFARAAPGFGLYWLRVQGVE